MAVTNNTVIQTLKGLRQSRAFTGQAIGNEDLNHILEVARWSGSSKNSQPWHMIVVRDGKKKEALAGAGAFTSFLSGADVVIVLAMKGSSMRSEAYDEGRLSERIMLAADALGIGSGTGWFSDEEAQQKVRELLDIPDDHRVFSALGLGYTETSKDQASGVNAGRKPLDEIVSYESFR